MTPAPRERVCFVVSSPMTAEAFLTRHIRALAERYEVHLVANAAPESITHPDLCRATRLRARIEREISPFADLTGLLQLARILRRGDYAAVHSLTPKAGLLTAVAAFLARVPVRMHTFTGQVWATRGGLSRRFFRSLDGLIARLDTHLLADSVSQRDFLRREGVLRAGEGTVLGNGSVSGVDAARFRPDEAARAEVRRSLGMPAEATVYLFAGRLTREKGVLDLAQAFARIAAERADAYLVLVGPDEEQLTGPIRETCGRHADRLRFAGYAADPERYMAAADVFCLPSYREGFGSVVVEAAAAGLPAIGSRIYGLVDAIEHERTGLLFEARDIDALAQAMRRLAEDSAFRLELARAARARALSDFPQDALTAALLDFYRAALARDSAPRQ